MIINLEKGERTQLPIFSSFNQAEKKGTAGTSDNLFDFSEVSGSEI